MRIFYHIKVQHEINVDGIVPSYITGMCDLTNHHFSFSNCSVPNLLCSVSVQFNGQFANPSMMFPFY